MYFTRWMCFFALLISADTKKCQKKRGLAIIIDSTMETDKEDFAVQVGVIRALSQQFVANRLNMSVQVYAYGGERCNELVKELDQGFFSIPRRRINTRLELLEHQPSNTTWDYECSKTMYDKVEKTLDDNVVKFGVILAKYDSIKQHMDPKEFEKYDEKGKYYLALVYSSGETSNLRKKISRRSSNIENLPALMDTICQEPGEIKDRSTIVKVTETTAMPEITPTKTTTKDIQTTSVDKSKSYSSMKLHEQSSSKKIVSQLSIEFSTSVLKKTTFIQVKDTKTIKKMSPSKTISTLKVVPSSLFENIISFTQNNSGLSTKPSSIIISPENTSYKLQTSVVVSRTISPSFTIKSSNYVKYSKSKNIKPQKAESSAMTPTKSVSSTLVVVNTASLSAAVITMLSMEQSSSIPVVSSSPVRANSTSINKQSSSTISSTKFTISPSAVVKTNVSTSVISASKSVFLSSTKILSNASNEISTSFHSAISTSSIMYSSQLPSSKMLSSFKTLSSSPSRSINTAIQTNINTIKNANRSASISASSINFSKSSIMTPSTRNATLPKLASTQSKSVSALSSSSYNVPLYTSELSSFATVTLSSIMMSKVLNKTVVPPILEKSSYQKISTLQTQLLSVSSSTGIKLSKTKIKASQTKIKSSSTKIKPSSTKIKPSSTKVKPSNSKTKMAKSKSKAVSGSLVALSSSMVFIPEVTSSTSYSIELSKTSSLVTTKQLMKTSSVDTPSKINILTESPSLVYSTSWVNSTTPLPAIVSRIRSSTSDSSLVVMATSRSSSIAVSSSILSIVIADLKKEIKDFLDAKPTSDQLKDKTWTSDFLKNSSNIIVHVGEEENNTQLTSESNELLLFIEDTLVEIGNHLPPGESLNYQTNETALEITAVDPLTFTGYTFASQKTSNESITLPRSVFSQTIMSEKNVIVGMSYNRLPSMKSSLEGIKYSGRVTAISINPAVVVPLLEPLSYTQNLPEGNYSQYHCVYWDMTDWSSKGCKVGNVNGSIVTCECDHMTPFSVLMQTATFTVSRVTES